MASLFIACGHATIVAYQDSQLTVANGAVCRVCYAFVSANKVSTSRSAVCNWYHLWELGLMALMSKPFDKS